MHLRDRESELSLHPEGERVPVAILESLESNAWTKAKGEEEMGRQAGSGV